MTHSPPFFHCVSRQGFQWYLNLNKGLGKGQGEILIIDVTALAALILASHVFDSPSAPGS